MVQNRRIPRASVPDFCSPPFASFGANIISSLTSSLREIIRTDSGDPSYAVSTGGLNSAMKLAVVAAAIVA